MVNHVSSTEYMAQSLLQPSQQPVITAPCFLSPYGYIIAISDGQKLTKTLLTNSLTILVRPVVLTKKLV